MNTGEYKAFNEMPIAVAVYAVTDSVVKIYNNKKYDLIFDNGDINVDFYLKNNISDINILYLDSREIVRISAVPEVISKNIYMVSFIRQKNIYISALKRIDINLFEYDVLTRKTYFDVNFNKLDENGQIMKPKYRVFENFPETIKDIENIYPDDRERYINEFNKFLNGKDKETIIDCRFRKDAKRFEWRRNRYNKVYSNNKLVKITATGEDLQIVTNAQNRYNNLINQAHLHEKKKYVTLLLSLSENIIKEANTLFIDEGKLVGKPVDTWINNISANLVKNSGIMPYTLNEIMERYNHGENIFSIKYEIEIAGNTLDMNNNYEIVRNPDTDEIVCLMTVRSLTREQAYKSITKYLSKNIYDYLFYVDANSGDYYMYTKNLNHGNVLRDFNTASLNVINQNPEYEFDLENMHECFNLRNLEQKLAGKRPFVKVLNCVKTKNNEKETYRFIADFAESDKILVLVMKDYEISNEENNANNVRSYFLDNISYNINTPLSTIIGMTDQALAEMNDEKSKEYLNTIKAAGTYLLSTLNDVLDMSRIQTHKIKTYTGIHSTEQFCSNILNMIAPIAVNKGIEFTLDKSGKAFDYQEFDLIHSQQIIINVLNNAIRYTSKGYVKWVVENEETNGITYCKHTIIDSGIGMNKRTLASLYEPVCKEKNSADNRGSGLGLTISRNLLELLEGKINIESKLHVGTTVTIWIPSKIEIKYVNTREIEKFKNSTDKLIGKKILIASDNKVTSGMVSRILSKYRIQVTIVKNGQEAVLEYSDRFDYVLMDVRMPVMDGSEAAKKIKAKSSKDVTVIGMSGNEFAEDILDALRSGMDDYIAKPINIHELISILLKYSI